VHELKTEQAKEADLDFRMGDMQPFERLPKGEADKVRQYTRDALGYDVPEGDIHALYWWGKDSFQNGNNGTFFGYAIRRVSLEELISVEDVTQ
jgi:hypothetical protein